MEDVSIEAAAVKYAQEEETGMFHICKAADLNTACFGFNHAATLFICKTVKRSVPYLWMGQHVADKLHDKQTKHFSYNNSSELLHFGKLDK